MKVLIAFINWGIVAVMAVGSIIFFREAFRKDIYMRFSERIMLGSIGMSCMIIGLLFFLGMTLA